MTSIIAKIKRRLDLVSGRIRHEWLARRLTLFDVVERTNAGTHRGTLSGWRDVHTFHRQQFPNIQRQRGRSLSEEQLSALREGNVDVHGWATNLNAVDWHREPHFGVRWPKVYRPIMSDLLTGSDQVLYWHFNKLEFLEDYVDAFRQTRDAKFVDRWVRTTAEWSRQNPFMVGMNWRSPMESGTRLLIWTRGVAALPFGESVSDDEFALFYDALVHHAEYLANGFQSKPTPNNHLIGEAALLFAFAAHWRGFADSDRWRQQSVDVLIAEIDRQLLPDGMQYENAFNYHIYVLDFYLIFLQACALTRETPPASIIAGVERLAQTVCDIISPSGRVPLFGDDSMTHFMVLRPLHEWVAGEDRVELKQLLCPGEVECIAATDWGARVLDVSSPLVKRTTFANAGFVVDRSAESHVVVTSGPTHERDFANGHLHADAGSFEMEFGGTPLIVDSGTYLYTYDLEARDYFKGPHAHSTVVIDSLNPLPVAGVFQWADVPRNVLTVEELGDGWFASIERTVSARAGMVDHRRIFCRVGTAVVIVDRLVPREGAEVGFDWEWLMHTTSSSDADTTSMVAGEVSGWKLNDDFHLYFAASSDWAGRVWRGKSEAASFPERYLGMWSPRYGELLTAGAVRNRGRSSGPVTTAALLGDNADQLTWQDGVVRATVATRRGRVTVVVDPAGAVTQVVS